MAARTVSADCCAGHVGRDPVAEGDWLAVKLPSRRASEIIIATHPAELLYAMYEVRRAQDERGRHRVELDEVGRDELAELLAAGRTPALGFYRKHIARMRSESAVVA